MADVPQALKAAVHLESIKRASLVPHFVRSQLYVSKKLTQLASFIYSHKHFLLCHTRHPPGRKLNEPKAGNGTDIIVKLLNNLMPHYPDNKRHLLPLLSLDLYLH